MRRVLTTSRGLLARQAARPATRLQLRCAAGPSANKRRLRYCLNSSVADPDPGSRIPNLYFWKLNDNFLGKKLYNSLQIGPHFFIHQFKIKTIFNFVIFVATKKGRTTNYFCTPLLCCCFWIRDRQKSGSGLNGSATLLNSMYKL